MPQTDRASLEAFAKKPTYKVLKRDRNAHIVSSAEEKLTSYVLFETPDAALPGEWIEKTDTCCLAMVKEFPGVRGVFHCYSGSAEDAKTLVKLGWHLSFTGTITFKNARKAPEVIAAVPLERLMVETDAPYMAPTPFRGKRCDSRYVYRMAETIAAIKGLTREEVEAATTENGRKLFGIPAGEA